jgi:predicted  nucleic acid-binding Zn-ribbon protein
MPGLKEELDRLNEQLDRSKKLADAQKEEISNLKRAYAPLLENLKSTFNIVINVQSTVDRVRAITKDFEGVANINDENTRAMVNAFQEIKTELQNASDNQKQLASAAAKLTGGNKKKCGGSKRKGGANGGNTSSDQLW